MCQTQFSKWSWCRCHAIPYHTQSALVKPWCACDTSTSGSVPTSTQSWSSGVLSSRGLLGGMAISIMSLWRVSAMNTVSPTRTASCPSVQSRIVRICTIRPMGTSNSSSRSRLSCAWDCHYPPRSLFPKKPRWRYDHPSTPRNQRSPRFVSLSRHTRVAKHKPARGLLIPTTRGCR